MSRLAELVAEHCPQGVELKSLGDVGTFIRGNGIQKKDLVGAGTPAIHYGQIFTHYGTTANDTKSFVTGTLAERATRAEHGDLVIATTSETDADVCRAVAWLGDASVAVSGDAYVYRHRLDPTFVAYFFQSEGFQTQKARHVTGTKVRRVNGAAMACIRIPVPPREVQVEVAQTLGTMERLRADLLAELAARHRQYQHYRQVLLGRSDEAGQRVVNLGDIVNLNFGQRITKRQHAGTEYPVYGGEGRVSGQTTTTGRTNGSSHGSRCLRTAYGVSAGSSGSLTLASRLTSWTPRLTGTLSGTCCSACRRLSSPPLRSRRRGT